MDRRFTPAVIAATATAVVGLTAVVSFLTQPADSRPASSAGDPATSAAAESPPSVESTRDRVSVASSTEPGDIEIEPPPALTASAVETMKPGISINQVDTAIPGSLPLLPERKPAAPSGSEITTVGATLSAVENRNIQQSESETAVPSADSRTTGTPDTTPPAPQPPSLAERLDVPIAAFTARPGIPVQSLIETVEVMANVSIEFSPAVPTDTVSRPVTLALRDTTPRKILSAVATRADLVIEFNADCIVLQPATE